MDKALYIVATPIGNLGDMTLRGIETLQQVAVIYAEDTRVTRVLLNRYEVQKPLRSYREAADRAQVEKTIQAIIAELQAGNSVAYVSDAGTPGISDPGDYLVSRVVERGFRVIPIPGASALPALLSVAGLGVQRPLFVGFLPKKKGRQTLLSKMREGLDSGLCDSIVLYESPERLLRTLQELLEWKRELQLCVGRELTKQFEEIVRGSIKEIQEHFTKKSSIKGEIVLIIRYA